MRPASLLIVALWFASMVPALSAQTSNTAPVQIFVSDGQLRMHPFRVFVNRPITEAMKPRLHLFTSHALMAPRPGEKDAFVPEWVAANQTEIREVQGTKISYIGTDLVFDVSRYPAPWVKPMIRVEPILEWDETLSDGSTVQRAVGGTVYLGNLPIAGLYSVASIILISGGLILISRGSGRPAIWFLCGPDGVLSLWRVQTAVWTAAVGAMLLLYGLLRKEVPSVPDTLVMLMGMTVVTGGLSHWQDKKNTAQPAAGPVENAPAPEAAPAPAAAGLPGAATTSLPSTKAPAPTQPCWSDLISDDDGQGGSELSITRAQLVFWTCLTVGLFVVKTSLEGVLWDVPGQLVALMGISQASYLGPKFINK